MHMIPCNGGKQRGAKEPPSGVKDESEKVNLKLKTQHLKNESHGIQSHYFMANRWGKSGSSERFYLLGFQNHCGW